MQEFCDNLPQERFDEELREYIYIYIDPDTGTYHTRPYVGGYLRRLDTGNIFLIMITNRLEEIDREHEVVNYFNASQEID